MGENGRLKVKKEFDRKIVVQAYMQAINEIVEVQNQEGGRDDRHELIRESYQ